MCTIKNRAVTNISESPGIGNSFAWSLKPLFILLKLIAIDLGHYEGRFFKFRSGLKSKLTHFLAYLWLAVNLTIHIYVFLLRLHEKSYRSSTFYGNVLIDQINYSFRNVAVHFSLLFMVRRRWVKLWECINQIESFIKNQPSIYRCLRITAIVGIFYVLLMVNLYARNFEPLQSVEFCILIILQAITIETLFAVTDNNHMPTKWFKKSVQILSFSMTVYSYASFILYGCLSQLACAGFQIIADDVRKRGSLLQIMDYAKAKDVLKEWKQNHEAVCAYVNELDASFGPILLFETSCIFIAFIIYCFYLINSIIHPDETCAYLIVLVLIKHLITLTVNCFITDKMKVEVRGFKNDEPIFLTCLYNFKNK